jgi:coenzyme F420-reducing hydrogenase gamma subunit
MEAEMTTNESDHLKHCTVERATAGQWAVHGRLPWTGSLSKEYAVCPTREAAEAARRLLSGDAAKVSCRRCKGAGTWCWRCDGQGLESKGCGIPEEQCWRCGTGRV